MSEDAEHKCHCAHVVVIQTKVAIVQWILGFCIVGVFTALISMAAQFASRRLNWEAPPTGSSERLFLDRVSKPEAPPRSDDR